MNCRSLIGGALAALNLFAAAPAAADATVVTDVLGREVAVPKKPERIVLGFYFEDFMAVGGPDAYDRVVAISKGVWEGWRNLQWKAYTAAIPRLLELADIGEVDAGTLTLESVLAARPDVVILAAWQTAALGEGVQRLEAAGVPVVALDYNSQTVERHVASTLALGRILGAEDRARRLADEYEAAVADVRRRVAAANDGAPSVYVELGRKGAGEVDNSYGDTMWGSIVGQVGGRNIAEGTIAKWGPLNAEFVLKERPDVIFLAGSGWVGRDVAVVMGPGVDSALTHARMRPYLDRPGWSGLPAVQNGQVYGIYHGGARTLYDYVFMQYIAKALHPSAFADVDPQANLDRFFAAYMPIEFSGTYMTKLP